MWKHRFSSMCQPFRDTWMELPQKQSLTNGPPNPRSGLWGSQGHWESQRGEGRYLYARLGVNGMDTLTPKRIFQLQNL